MAKIVGTGNDNTVLNQLWFWTQPITCPRCATIFLLTAEDTMPGVVGPIGTNSTLWLGWRQVVEGDPATAQAIDTVNLHVDPAQIYGPCPYCAYNPITVKGPRYGVAKITMTSDPNGGLIQSYIAGGAARASFFLPHYPDSPLIAALLTALGQPYGTDSTGLYAISVRRIGTDIYDAATLYLFATPAYKLTVEEAMVTDAGLTEMLSRMGLQLGYGVQ